MTTQTNVITHCITNDYMTVESFAKYPLSTHLWPLQSFGVIPYVLNVVMRTQDTNMRHLASQ